MIALLFLHQTAWFFVFLPQSLSPIVSFKYYILHKIAAIKFLAEEKTACIHLVEKRDWRTGLLYCARLHRLPRSALALSLRLSAR